VRDKAGLAGQEFVLVVSTENADMTYKLDYGLTCALGCISTRLDRVDCFNFCTSDTIQYYTGHRYTNTLRVSV
jgi:hypothetical protein